MSLPKSLAPLVLASSLVLPATASEPTADPWESLNRKVYAFNDYADRYVVKPVATWYDDYTPRPVNDGVTHFFDNLSEFATFTNAILQWKPAKAASSITRFVLNSTVGLLGFFDVATRVGVAEDKEDFGQTLAYWGLPSGPYVVLPLLGPSTVRDAAGRAGDFLAKNQAGEINMDTSLSMVAVDGVDTRAGLLTAEEFMMGDRYLFMRDAYLSRRAAANADGEVVDDFGDEDFESFDEEPLE